MQSTFFAALVVLSVGMATGAPVDSVVPSGVPTGVASSGSIATPTVGIPSGIVTPAVPFTTPNPLVALPTSTASVDEPQVSVAAAPPNSGKGQGAYVFRPVHKTTKPAPQGQEQATPKKTVDKAVAPGNAQASPSSSPTTVKAKPTASATQSQVKPKPTSSTMNKPKPTSTSAKVSSTSVPVAKQTAAAKFRVHERDVEELPVVSQGMALPTNTVTASATPSAPAVPSTLPNAPAVSDTGSTHRGLTPPESRTPDVHGVDASAPVPAPSAPTAPASAPATIPTTIPITNGTAPEHSKGVFTAPGTPETSVPPGPLDANSVKSFAVIDDTPTAPTVPTVPSMPTSPIPAVAAPADPTNLDGGESRSADDDENNNSGDDWESTNDPADDDFYSGRYEDGGEYDSNSPSFYDDESVKAESKRSEDVDTYEFWGNFLLPDQIQK
ncbi:hypothetical protein K474DRAFT_651201 [Panus rudis PR-1116 ss-1]|nr:hypothetical protein K474DRAFT_651201 [Panus rudis PR-1116 ss-1]